MIARGGKSQISSSAAGLISNFGLRGERDEGGGGSSSGQSRDAGIGASSGKGPCYLVQKLLSLDGVSPAREALVLTKGGTVQKSSLRKNRTVGLSTLGGE